MQLHRVTIDTAWRPDLRGVQHRQYLARCLCGWSEGWLQTRHEAARSGDHHRELAAAGAAVGAAAAARRSNHPDPAA